MIQISSGMQNIVSNKTFRFIITFHLISSAETIVLDIMILFAFVLCDLGILDIDLS